MARDGMPMAVPLLGFKGVHVNLEVDHYPRGHGVAWMEIDRGLRSFSVTFSERSEQPREMK